jgi:RNA polymerase sigma-70 factor (ECF subfamily)
MSDNRQPDEFVRLLLQHQFRLYGFILSLVPNCADADDVMQETSAALWEMFDKYETNTDFGAWACRVAKYRVLKFRERQSRAPVFTSDDVLERIAEASLGQSDASEARRQALSRCVQHLSPPDSELLRQVYDPATRTLKQVAEVLARPANTVYKAVRRIHQMLFECMERTIRAEERGAEMPGGN